LWSPEKGTNKYIKRVYERVKVIKEDDKYE
jgi:hypothetical protein